MKMVKISSIAPLLIAIIGVSTSASTTTTLAFQTSSSSPTSFRLSKNRFGTTDHHVVWLKSTPAFQSQDPFPNDASPDDNPNEEDDDDTGTSTLKASRFHKLAPDANLSTDDFRAQLRENMKADLEKRRQLDPNRGNQPAKNYLDNL